MMTNQPSAPWSVLVLSLFLIANSPTPAQRPAPKPAPLPDGQLPAFATSLAYISAHDRQFNNNDQYWW